MFPAYFIFNSLLVLLLLLHIAWTYLILLIVKSSLKSGQVREREKKEIQRRTCCLCLIDFPCPVSSILIPADFSTSMFVDGW